MREDLTDISILTSSLWRIGLIDKVAANQQTEEYHTFNRIVEGKVVGKVNLNMLEPNEINMTYGGQGFEYVTDEEVMNS